MLPGSLRADTVYTYTGNPCQYCAAPLSCGGGAPYLSLTFDTSLMGADLANLQFTNITADVKSFTMTDNAGTTMDQNNSAGNPLFIVSTGPDGSILEWVIWAYANSTELNSCYFPSNPPECDGLAGAFDETIFYPQYPGGIDLVSDINGDPGSWTVTTPEPGAIPLTLSGLGFLGLVTVRRKRRAPNLPQAT